MNYELAKKLKDAGYPQDFSDGRIAVVNSNNSDYAFPPTLSELIDACGDGFDYLERYTKDIWTATDGDYIFEQGLTPEDAVANLYIKLNSRGKKK